MHSGAANLLVELRASPLFFFFFNDTATTEIYTLSLHDALPIFINVVYGEGGPIGDAVLASPHLAGIHFTGSTGQIDRKSTRLNSSHSQISYAVFCLKKKNKHK